MMITRTKAVLSGILLAVSTAGYAQSDSVYGRCAIDLNNELHLDGDTVEIIDAQGQSALIRNGADLVIEGKRVPLSVEQQRLLDEFLEGLQSVIPQARSLVAAIFNLINELIDEAEAYFEAPDAFDDVRLAMHDFYTKVEARYQQDGRWVLPPNAFDQALSNWQQDLSDAREVFNQAFFDSAFAVLKEKFSSEEGINWTALQQQITGLANLIEQKIQSHSGEIQQQSEAYCDALGDLAEKEQGVIESIPELKGYQLFEI